MHTRTVRRTRTVTHYRFGSPSRFHYWAYWVFAVWALEMVFWTGAALVWTTGALISLVHTYLVNRRASRSRSGR